MFSPLTALRIRMGLALGGLTALTIGLVAGVTAFFSLVFGAVVGQGTERFAPLVALGVLVGVGALEYRGPRTIERLAGARPVAAGTQPALERAAVRAASQLDVPAPTVAVSDRSAPEALVVGLRPSTAHLVVSRGTIDALDDAELAAVVAHELAHVANRDAMVMTVVSLPVVLADGLRSRLHGMGEHGYPLPALPLALVAAVVSVAGRTVLARVSRARERVADRAAATVTGSPAALASALRTLDGEIERTPDRDLRAASTVSALSVLPLDPHGPSDVMLGPDGEVEPSYGWLSRLEQRLYGTHPPTAVRIDALAALERDAESERAAVE